MRKFPVERKMTENLKKAEEHTEKSVAIPETTVNAGAHMGPKTCATRVGKNS